MVRRVRHALVTPALPSQTHPFSLLGARRLWEVWTALAAYTMTLSMLAGWTL